MGVLWECSVLSSWTDGVFQLPYRYECRREGCDSHGHIRGGQSLPHLRGKAACGGGEVGGAYAEVTCVHLQETHFSVVRDSVFCSGHLGSFQMSGLELMGCALSGGKGLSQGICRMLHITGWCPLILVP